MKLKELKDIIVECCNDVFFIYNGKNSGITSEVKNHIPTFQVWHGDSTKEYGNIDDVMNDKFYSGKSINELLTEIDFTFA